MNNLFAGLKLEIFEHCDYATAVKLLEASSELRHLVTKEEFFHKYHHHEKIWWEAFIEEINERDHLPPTFKEDRLDAIESFRMFIVHYPDARLLIFDDYDEDEYIISGYYRDHYGLENMARFLAIYDTLR